MVNPDPTLTRSQRDWGGSGQEARRAAEQEAAAARAVGKPDYRRTRSATQQQHPTQSLLLAGCPTLESGDEDKPEAPSQTLRPSTVFVLGAIAFAALAGIYTSLHEPWSDADATFTTGEIALPSPAAPNVLPAAGVRPPIPPERSNVVLSKTGRRGGMSAGGRAVTHANAADGSPPSAPGRSGEEADSDDVAAFSSAEWLPEAHPDLHPVEAAILSDLADPRKLRVDGQKVEEDMPSVGASTSPELELVPVRQSGELSRSQPGADHLQPRQVATTRGGDLQVAAGATAPAFPMRQEPTSRAPGDVATEAVRQPVYRLQLASVSQESSAHRAWTKYKRDFATLLARLDPVIERAEVAGATMYRVRAGSFQARSEAESICRRLRDQGAECLVVAARS